MLTFSTMRISARLGFGFASAIISLVLLTTLGARELYLTSTMVDKMVALTMTKERLFSEWAANTNVNGARTIAVAETSDQTRAQQAKAKIKVTSERISEIQKSLEALDKNPEETALLAKVGEQRKIYIAARDLVFKQKDAGADNVVALLQEKLEPALDTYVASIKALSAYQASALDSYAATTRSESTNSIRLLAAICLLTVVAVIALAWKIASSIKQQLGGEPNTASDIVRRIADGDLTVSVALAKDDDGSMMHAMKGMRNSLVDIVSRVRVGTESMATASREIAQGNQDLSNRTEAQAGALEETASSMEELTSTLKQNADNARQANQLASSASDVAVKGGTAVAQVVATMGSINESSRRIVEIISVIDGIAFQTNILALNAAVEAARAGEQGRGFAVVASEVRNLAQRSAAAAKEIKGLISDSVEKVDHGSTLVNQAGDTMREVVDSIGRVRDMVAAITTATIEQSLGVEQVNRAIIEMDGMTQQNAALVEQAAAAAIAMQDQASHLNEIVAVFQTGNRGVQAAASAQVPDHQPAYGAQKRPALRIAS
jgi:methyl-accepting chemotaxis protein